MLAACASAAEGVVAAAALKCLGGAIQGRLYPRDDAERAALVAAGYDPTRVLTTQDLVAGEDVFFAATGITDGSLLRGVRYGDAATMALIELVDRDPAAKGAADKARVEAEQKAAAEAEAAQATAS